MMPNLNEQFLNLWYKIGAVGNPKAPYADLVSHYVEPWRSYHTLAHIETMLAEFDEFREHRDRQTHLFSVPMIQMAIWYHDVIYNPRAKDNEEKSADLFRVVAESAFLIGTFSENVVMSILATKHLVTPDDFNAAIVCDIDLAILGQSGEIFDEYERQIRKEYEWVPEVQFREGRASILQSFLGRRTIYSTRFFREKYENQARQNLARSIEKLKSFSSHLYLSAACGGLFSRD